MMDPCYYYSDRYLMAITLVYFHRAKLAFHEFTVDNFFALLHLANDMEEDFVYQVGGPDTLRVTTSDNVMRPERLNDQTYSEICNVLHGFIPWHY